MYVDERLVFLDTKTYYLSEDGDDLEAAPGNALKPYGTVSALVTAVSALPSGSRVTIFVYPGVYSGDFIILAGNYNMIVTGKQP